MDLSGFQLGDMEGSGRYMFPSSTVIRAGEYLVVYCDATVKDKAYAPFAISRAGGEVFYLIGSNGAIVDQVTTLPTDMDQSLIRGEDDTWMLSSRVTPGAPNSETVEGVQDFYNSGVSAVQISEFSAADNG